MKLVQFSARRESQDAEDGVSQCHHDIRTTLQIP